MMVYEKKLDKLIDYINLTEVKNVRIKYPYVYNHMGATIVDSILQAGMKYDTIVASRINLLLHRCPDFKTTSDFLELMRFVPIESLINWHNQVKISRIKSLTWFLFCREIENEIQLKDWLVYEQNRNELIKIKGIGPKTVDYLFSLCGGDAIPIDRHLLNYLNSAGIVTKSYSLANHLYSMAADELNITKQDLDKKIWLYMSRKDSQ